MDSFMRYVTYIRQKHAGLLDSHQWVHAILLIEKQSPQFTLALNYYSTECSNFDASLTCYSQ